MHIIKKLWLSPEFLFLAIQLKSNGNIQKEGDLFFHTSEFAQYFQ
jgi:hypothetical protein